MSKLDELKPGRMVYVKALIDVGSKGIVLRKDKSSESYWVNVGMSKIRGNRKHLFLLNSVVDRVVPGDSNDLPRRNSRSEFVPVGREPVATSSVRVSKPPLKYGMEYYK